jgi:hypothetical protein
MSTNDRVLLDTIVADKRMQIAPDVAEDDFFELFLAEQLLWDHDLSWDELQSGLIGGGDDGGMDGIYIFCNGGLLDVNGDPLANARTATNFELIIIQAKRTPSFSETSVDKLSSSLLRLLDLGTDLHELQNLYNADVLAWFDNFRKSYVTNATNFPTIDLAIYYATRGFEVGSKTAKKAADLEVAICSLFSSSKCKFNFITPSDLVAYARRQRPTTLDLRLDETIATSAGAFVGLVSIVNYFDFLSSENGELRAAIFESNVRDYEGVGGINASIRKTLQEDLGDDFWWLNNGVTIVASRAFQYGKTLTLEYPQIVNGLQTSREIYEYLAAMRKELKGQVEDRRSVLVRVIVPPSDVSRDRIIRATNSQTSIPSVALRATDKIQRDLEDYFLRQGWFYERRKNRYQNEGKPTSRIITIPYLAEAVSAIILKEPHLGGPRIGGRFLKSEETYERIFDASIPLATFLKCAQLCRLVEQYLIRLPAKELFGEEESNDEVPAVAPSSSVSEASEDGGATTRRSRRRRSGQPRYRAHRYLLPTAMALAMSQSRDQFLADLDPDSLKLDEVPRWIRIVASLDPAVTAPNMKADRAERLLAQRLLEVLAKTERPQ